MTELDLKPPPDFDTWYAVYPKKKDKGAARKAYKNALKLATPRTLQDAVEAFEAIWNELTGYRGKKKDDLAKALKWCKYPATWLNKESYNDEEIKEYLSKPKETGTMLKEGEPGFTEYRDHLIAQRPSMRSIYENRTVFVVPAPEEKT